MTTTDKQAREAKRQAILDALNAPSGRERSNKDIAQQCEASIQLVIRVRKANLTPEEKAEQERKTEAHMKALDDIFPGIYAFHMHNKAKHEHKPDGFGSNSSNFGRLLTSADLLQLDVPKENHHA